MFKLRSHPAVPDTGPQRKSFNKSILHRMDPLDKSYTDEGNGIITVSIKLNTGSRWKVAPADMLVSGYWILHYEGWSLED